MNGFYNLVKGGSVGIKVNDDAGPYFQTKKVLRQGDPLSPMLFNIVTDILAIFLNRAKDRGTISGVVPHLVEDGPSFSTLMTRSFLWNMIWINLRILKLSYAPLRNFLAKR